jgi:methionyl-tRNA formyltransferase
MNVVILASGNLGESTLRRLVADGLRPLCVFTDNGSTGIIELCQELGIFCFRGNPRNGRGAQYLQTIGGMIDVIFSINFLFMIERDIIELPRLGCLNIHGSLLPKYRGRTPHVWAIINNEEYGGATVHLIDEGCDTGAVLLQEKVLIERNATGASMLAAFEELYPRLVRETLILLGRGEITVIPQDHSLATYFGKRTPDDGTINWQWQKERIFNWVRAQSYPYPGAFTFRSKDKIVIDWIEFSGRGFRYNDPDGLVLFGGEQPEIKTPNGAVRIVKQRTQVQLVEGDVLN